MGYEVIADLLSKKDRTVILNGATGTEIYRRRVRSDPDLPWSLEGLAYRPDIVRDIHYDYYRSGANVVTASCFYTTRYAFQRSKISPEMAKSFTFLGVLLCRDAQRLAQIDGARQPTCVAGNVAPLETKDPYNSKTVPQKELAIEEHSEKIKNLLDAGVDLILIETMTTLHEASAALQAYDDVGKKTPFWISFVCDRNGVMYSGEEISEAADLVESYSPEVLLVNCTPIDGVTLALKKLQGITSIPLGAYASVEEPVYHESSAWARIPSLSASQYAHHCKKWLKLGVRVVGGCCGTTPEDIAEIVRLFGEKEDE